MELLGPLPRKLIKEGKAARQYYNKSGHLSQHSGLGVLAARPRVLLREVQAPTQRGRGAVVVLAAELHTNPHSRIKAGEALKHRWLHIPPFPREPSDDTPVKKKSGASAGTGSAAGPETSADGASGSGSGSKNGVDRKGQAQAKASTPAAAAKGGKPSKGQPQRSPVSGSVSTASASTPSSASQSQSRPGSSSTSVSGASASGAPGLPRSYHDGGSDDDDDVRVEPVDDLDMADVAGDGHYREDSQDGHSHSHAQGPHSHGHSHAHSHSDHSPAPAEDADADGDNAGGTLMLAQWDIDDSLDDDPYVRAFRRGCSLLAWLRWPGALLRREPHPALLLDLHLLRRLVLLQLVAQALAVPAAQNTCPARACTWAIMCARSHRRLQGTSTAARWLRRASGFWTSWTRSTSATAATKTICLMLRTSATSKTLEKPWQGTGWAPPCSGCGAFAIRARVAFRTPAYALRLVVTLRGRGRVRARQHTEGLVRSRRFVIREVRCSSRLPVCHLKLTLGVMTSLLHFAPFCSQETVRSIPLQERAEAGERVGTWDKLSVFCFSATHPASPIFSVHLILVNKSPAR